MAESGEEAPTPLASRTYSGKFALRIPPEKHRELAIEAAEQHVSLNQLVVSRL
ncbi:MAG: toxin-antitoxin system HicB family antitoxin [Adlercreutzia equolifaciens]|jgi:predicted HicB family RNase H-like nuclease|nr:MULTISPECIES: toxin-antitoxin system HicB family antitoxin [Adlercreutzia]MCB6975134.1 type II toxin-antitoxin system HicB family antitoxin [Adlercreutzia equolifaciens]MCQ5070168.1 type II toxin-antitoxin system HicB family antitoxin [Adlercreutzia sp. DFI.6.23]MDE8683548.1 toxin-antitoxin system HicB family antitoxin [Adlercreutzia rubneri]MEE0307955.1 toxin-antitoxin system HicB family antitoxin [Adlercreutzia sp.]MEE0344848.1 toxin-antitoxin system HicB family antitoxin [Adlercreutzia s